VESQRKRVAPEVDAVDPKELVRRPIEEIEAELVQRLRIDMPVLDREHTVSLPNEEIDIDVSGETISTRKFSRERRIQSRG
jgi:hypothetical protein